MDAPFKSELTSHLALYTIGAAIVGAALGYALTKMTAQAPSRTSHQDYLSPVPFKPDFALSKPVSSEPKTKYDVKKWQALKEVDSDIAAATERVSKFAARYEDELAEKYLILNDKAYLEALITKVEEKAQEEAEAVQRKRSESETIITGGGALAFFEKYKKELDDHYGRDPVNHKNVRSVTQYDGAYAKFLGGIKIVFSDRTVAFRTPSMVMNFKSEEEATDWGA